MTAMPCIFERVAQSHAQWTLNLLYNRQDLIQGNLVNLTQHIEDELENFKIIDTVFCFCFFVNLSL